MKRILSIALMCLLALSLGCEEKDTAKNTEKLVPNARERELLRVYRVDVNTERGQRKLRKIRDNRKRRQEARERMTAWQEESRARKEKEAAAEAAR